jgi:hypothetical protein
MQNCVRFEVHSCNWKERAAGVSETVDFYQMIRRHDPEDCNHNTGHYPG